jgi:hypothetical protein
MDSLGATVHQQLLDRIETELGDVGCILTQSSRDRMVTVLRRIDGVTTRQEAETLVAELGRLIQEVADEGPSVVTAPEVWLGQAECA